MNKTSIDWPGLGYTWNPVTGCRRGCSYCYARKIHERFYKTPFSDIVFHPERLDDPDLYRKAPCKIFVGMKFRCPEGHEFNAEEIDGVPSEIISRCACGKQSAKKIEEIKGNPLFLFDDNELSGKTG